MVGFDFVVLGKAAVVIEPRESALDDPTLGQDAEAAIEFWNDLQPGALATESFAHPGDQGSRITAIGKNHP